MCTDKPKPLPSGFKSNGELVRSFVNYFQDKVSMIHSSITPSFQTSDIGNVSLVSSDLVSFQLQSTEAMTKLIKQCASKSCPLDTIPTVLLKDDIILSAVVPHITHIVNCSLESGQVPGALKVARVVPRLKKEGAMIIISSVTTDLLATSPS